MDKRREAEPVMSRNALGEFLRSRREKQTPQAIHLKSGRRRRTAGLRREEVAELAGIGVDWYIRLEQGRTVSPSVTTISALARALRLNTAEHTHLRALARNPARSGFLRESIPDSMRRLVESLPHPAYITGRRWDVLAWNHSATEVFTDFSRMPQEDRNILLYVLTSPAMRDLFGNAWAGEVKRMLALFRTTYDLWAGDPAFESLLRKLRDGCPEFEQWWETHDVSSSTGVQKLLRHSSKGLLRFDTASFQSNEDPSLKLTIYTPI